MTDERRPMRTESTLLFTEVQRSNHSSRLPAGERLPDAPRILYLVHRVPHPPNRGDRIRSYHQLRFLTARSRVWLACLADEPVPAETTQALNQWCEEVAIISLGRSSRWLNAAASLAKGGSATSGLFRSPQLTRLVQTWAGRCKFDAVVVFCSSMLQYANLQELAGVPQIVDLVDVDSQKWLDYAGEARGPKRLLFQLEAARLRRLEQQVPRQAHAVLLTTVPEANLYRSVAPNDRTYALPNGVDLEYFAPQTDAEEGTRANLVFVGALDYRANIEGVRWFCRAVWPLVREKMPDATLTLVGRQPTADVRQLAALPGVRIAADVPDVRPYLAAATLSIAPLQVARGVQNKVLEAMAMAKCVIASPQAIEGLDLEPGENIWQAASPAEWVDCIARLSRSPELRSQTGRAARAFVQQHHRWATCLQPLEQLLHLQSPAAPRQVAAV